VPTDVRDELTTVEWRVVPVNVLASAVIVMLALPSKVVPLMVLPGLKVEADVALPERAPTKVVAVTAAVLGLTETPVLVFRGWFPVAVLVKTK